MAWATDWPGWCRSGAGREAALETLLAYRSRYQRVAARAGLRVPAARATDLAVVDTLEGSAVTDFGAPGAIGQADRARLDGAAAARLVALLDAAWAELESVAAASPPVLRKGPRGGGRDRQPMLDHVIEAERSYARRIGVRISAAEWRTGHVGLLRERIREAIGKPSTGATPDPRAWPPRYFTRRAAWHVLDHAWEMEDRAR